MPVPAPIDPSDPSTWPVRMYRSEVCQVLRVSRHKLREMIKHGEMPEPVARGREALFDREQVASRLGLRAARTQDDEVTERLRRGLETVFGEQ